MVCQDSDKPPTILFAPSKFIKIKLRGEQSKIVGFIVMLTPTKVSYYYVFMLKSIVMDRSLITLYRYDIRHNKGQKTMGLVSAKPVLN